MSCNQPPLPPQATKEDHFVLHKRSKYSKFAPKVYESLLLSYDSNSHAYRVFNVITGCVKITCDAVFDETNGSQKEQVDHVDDEEVPWDTLQRMTIGDVRPQDPNDQPQKPTPNDTTSPAQGLDQNKHEDKDEQQDKVQEESNDQEGDENVGTREKDHHIQECTTMFKEITSLITYLMISKKG
jgi:hypothetical protein